LDDKIVFYDDFGTAGATRAWFLIKILLIIFLEKNIFTGGRFKYLDIKKTMF